MRTLLSCALFVIGLAQITAGENASVTVLFRDNYGRSLPRGVLVIRDGRGAAVFNREVIGLHTSVLPYGRYEFSFVSQWTHCAPRQISIKQPTAVVLLTSDVEVMETVVEPVSISIQVKPRVACAASGVIWAGLSGVFSDVKAERPVGPSGYALFDDLQPGQYTLVVVEADAVRAVKGIKTNGPVTVISTELTPCPR